MELSKRCMQVVGSLTLAIDAKAKKMKAEGLDVVGFGAGEPDFAAPDNVMDAAREAIDKKLTKYTPSEGTLELRKAICAYLLKINGIEYKPEEIVVSNGAKHSLYNSFTALLNEGDEVIIPAPYWVSYPEMVKMAGGTPVFVAGSENNGFRICAESLEKVVTAKTKAIVINSPSNPCGTVYGREELVQFAQIAQKHDLAIVADDIYQEIIYDMAPPKSIASLGEDAKERTILVNGLSKSAAMTGWRIGYTASNAKIAKLMANYQSHATSNANSIAQYASVAALTGPQDALKMMVGEFDKRRKYMHERINQIPLLSCILPQGAFYIMLNIKQIIGKTYKGRMISDSMGFAESLLEAKMVAAVPGVAFGAEGYMRLSYATSMETIRKGLDRIAEYVSELD